MELLIGCGHSREKKLNLPGHKAWKELVTLDINPDTGCDVVHDLEVLPYPFADNTFDEVHAYEVLEHIGEQGDYQTFFKQFEELHRILKPGGNVVASVPYWESKWAWGDPSHKRVINEGTLSFLEQKAYAECGQTSRTDFRFCYKVDFEIVYLARTEDHLFFVLKAL